MKRDPEVEQRIATVNGRMRSDWITWGLAPLAVVFVLVLVITRLGEPDKEVVNMELLDRAFQGVLAVSALLFLIAFWLDGHWTNSDKLARKIWLAAGGGRFNPTASQLALWDTLAFKSILNAVKTLTITGCAIGIAAVIGSIAGLGFAHSCQLVVMAIAYQIFVLSRHPYYSEILQAAADGELVVTAPDKDKAG